MTAVAHVVEKSSNPECQMSDIIDSDMHTKIYSVSLSPQSLPHTPLHLALRMQETDSGTEQNKWKEQAGYVQE